MAETVSIFFPLNMSFGKGMLDDPDDANLVDRALRRLGVMRKPVFGSTNPMRDIYAGLERFQRDNDLAIDGFMRTRGPTAAKLAERLNTSLAGPTPPSAGNPWPWGAIAQATARTKPAASTRPPSRQRPVILGTLDHAGNALPQPPRPGIKPPPPKAPKPRGPEESARIKQAMDALTRFRASGSATPVPGRKPTPPPTQPSNADLLFLKYRERLRPREGGFADRPKSEDRGGPTQKGMSQEALDALRAKKPEYRYLPERSRDLTDAQITEIFRKEYFLLPQVDKLAAVPGLQEDAPQLAELIFDSNILHGADNAGEWLQEALDEKLGTDLKTYNPETGELEYDGVIGSKTRAAVAQAVSEGVIQEVNNLVVEKRLSYAETRPNRAPNPGWTSRIKSFRIVEQGN